MAFAIDGTNTALSVNGASATTSIAAALTTTNSCVVWTAVQNAGSGNKSTTQSTITDNSGLGLTWTLRASFAVANGFLELWSAVCPSAVTMTVTCTFAHTTETACMVVWGTDGANTLSLLDPNASMPVQVGFSSSPSTNSISTTNAPDFGILIAGAMNCDITGVTGGWTLLATAQQTNVDNFQVDLQVYYQQFPGVQTGLSSAVSTNNSQLGGVLIVALNAAPAPTVTRARCVMVGF